jgi:hypothetical protein
LVTNFYPQRKRWLCSLILRLEVVKFFARTETQVKMPKILGALAMDSSKFFTRVLTYVKSLKFGNHTVLVHDLGELTMLSGEYQSAENIREK